MRTNGMVVLLKAVLLEFPSECLTREGEWYMERADDGHGDS
ncbi:hypothetical protein [Propionispora vibrioides]|nr:hypothetical protein [Propionispora vibrioides]